jgi:hypothetical protein
MIKPAFAAVIVLVATSLLAADQNQKPGSSDVTGKWKSEFDTPVGHLKYVYELKANGDKLTGTASRERDGVKTETELKDVAVHGDQVSFVEPIKIQDQDVRIEYQGKLAGNEIKFTRKVGDFATTEIVARRAAESTASVDGKWKGEFDSQIGKQTYVYELKADGERLTGKAIGESQFGKFDTAISEGKVTPSGVSFVEMLKLPDREIRIEYTGKLVGSDLKLTRKVGDIATEEFVAKQDHDSSGK